MQRRLWILLAALAVVGLALQFGSDAAQDQPTTYDAPDDMQGGSLTGTGDLKRDAVAAAETPLDTTAAKDVWSIHGRVHTLRNDDLVPMPARVRAWLLSTSPPTLVGTAHTRSNGQYSIPVPALMSMPLLQRLRARLFVWADAPGLGTEGLFDGGFSTIDSHFAHVLTVGLEMKSYELTLREGATVRGRATNANNTPAFDAHVRLKVDDHEVQEMCTAPDGSFAFVIEHRGVGQVSIRHRTGGVYKSESFRIGDHTQHNMGPLLLLATDKAIEGVVTDRNGKPLAGAPVGIVTASDDDLGSPYPIFASPTCASAGYEFESTTDTNGHFRLHVPSGQDRTTLEVLLGGEMVSQANTRAGATDVQIPIEHHVMWIRVESPDGAPLPNMRVFFTRSGGAKWDEDTGADGRVALAIEDGFTWIVSAFHAEWGSVQKTIVPPADKAQSHWSMRFSSSVAKEVVTFYAADADGKPLGLVYADLMTDDFTFFETNWSTLPTTITLPVGTYTISLSPHKESKIDGKDLATFADLEAEFTVHAGVPQDVRLVARRLGFIRLATAGPAIPFESSGREDIDLNDEDISLHRWGFHLNKPKLLRPGVLPGRYKLMWKHTSYETATAVFDVKPGEVTDVTLHITPK